MFVFSSFNQTSSEITVHQVKTAISFKISFLLSQNQGALTQIILNDHLNFVKTIEVNASHSISSAIITNSFFHSCETSSSNGKIH
jgi:hypothetical protein